MLNARIKSVRALKLCFQMKRSALEASAKFHSPVLIEWIWKLETANLLSPFSSAAMMEEQITSGAASTCTDEPKMITKSLID